MYGVILCGGSGTRLWPLSRKNFPKQFLKLYSDKSLLQETYLRVSEFIPKESIYFVTNNANASHVLDQMREIEPSFSTHQIIIEPASQNTAPAMALAVKYLLSERGARSEEKILFLPADHYIGNRKAYVATVTEALEHVGENIGTIGIEPSKPETGYGYIQKGEKRGASYQVLQFCEKPTLPVAEEYLRSGEYVWNSGMYLFAIETFLEETEKYAPEIATLMGEKVWETFLEKFVDLPSISFDYAVSEKSDRVVVFEGNFGWNDIGSFDSLAEMSGSEFPTRHIGIDSKNIFAHSAENRLITTIGVEDLVIIDSGDSILIHKRGRAEDVKKIVEKLKENGPNEFGDHKRV